MLEQLLYILNGLVQEKEIVLGPLLISKLKSINDKVSNFILNCAAENLDLDNTDYSFIETTEDDGMVSFLKNRWETEADKFNSSRREKMKISRLIMALSAKKNVVFSNTEIEDFVNKYKASQKVKDNVESIKLIKGKDIIHYYNEDNYEKGGGDYCSLYRSCMRYEKCGEYFTVYTDNPNVSLCVLLSPDKKVEARAIVWSNIIVNNKVSTYMDRIYSINDGAEKAMKIYAEEKGWWFKVKQGNDNDEICDGQQIVRGAKMTALLPHGIEWKGRGVKKPYMDTLRFLKYTIHNNEITYCLENHYYGNDYMELWDEQDGTYDSNGRYENPFGHKIAVSKLSNVPLGNVERLNDEEYEAGGGVYQIININMDSLRKVLMENPDLIAIAGDVKDFVSGRMLVVDLNNDINEYVKSNTENIFYETIDNNTIIELINSNDDDTNKQVLKKIVSNHFAFFKKRLNVMGEDMVVVKKELADFIDKYDLASEAKVMVGRIYKVIEKDKNHSPHIDRLKKFKWIKITGNYDKFINLTVPEHTVEPINIQPLDKKNLKNIDYVVSLFDNESLKPLLINLMTEALLLKYRKGAIIEKEPEVGDRIIITKDDNSRRSTDNNSVGEIVENDGDGDYSVIFNKHIQDGSGSSLHGMCEEGWGKVIKGEVFNVIDKNFKLEEFTILLNKAGSSFIKILCDNVSEFSYKKLIKIMDISDDIFYENIDLGSAAEVFLYDEDMLEALVKEISVDEIYLIDRENGEIIYKNS